MQSVISPLMSLLPAEPDFLSALKFIGIFSFAVLFVGLLARVVIGKKSSLNHSVSAAMGILCIYLVTMLVHAFNPYGLNQYLSPLPFVEFQNETLRIFSFQTGRFPDICREILSMVILAFLVNLTDSLIPKGKKIIVWFICRFLCVICSMVAHYFVTWAFHAYIPGLLAAYAPIILLGILASLFVLGLLNVILSVVLTVVNPIIGGLYAFFFSSLVGKQISKALVTTAILSAFVYALNYLGYTLISIAPAALIAYLPMIAILLILWYIIGHLL